MEIGLSPVEKLMLLELLNDSITTAEGITYAVFLTEPVWDTAAGAAIAYCVEILPAFDYSMDESPLMALPQDVLSFLLGYLTAAMWAFFNEHIITKSYHNLRIHRTIAIPEHGAAIARSQSQPG